MTSHLTSKWLHILKKDKITIKEAKEFKQAVASYKLQNVGWRDTQLN